MPPFLQNFGDFFFRKNVKFIRINKNGGYNVDINIDRAKIGLFYKASKKAMLILVHFDHLG